VKEVPVRRPDEAGSWFSASLLHLPQWKDLAGVKNRTKHLRKRPIQLNRVKLNRALQNFERSSDWENSNPSCWPRKGLPRARQPDREWNQALC
jgi:hypothetical protein